MATLVFQGTIAINLSKCRVSDCGRTNSVKTRIIGGKNVKKGEFPFSVVVTDSDIEYVECSGSIINDRWILSTADCAFDGTFKRAFVGITDLNEANETNEVKIEKAIHHRFNNGNGIYNIGLLKTAQPMSKVGEVNPVCLPFDNANLAIGERAIIIGYGSDNSTVFWENTGKLRAATVKILPDSSCKSFYTQAYSSYHTCALVSINIFQPFFIQWFLCFSG